MKPYEYLVQLNELTDQIETLLNLPDEMFDHDIFQNHEKKRNALLNNASKIFPFYSQSMTDEKHIYSPHDGCIEHLKLSKNGILHLKFNTSIYEKEHNEQVNGSRVFDVVMKIDKIPSGGILLKRDAIILNMLFSDNEFVIEFLPPDNHSKSFIESYEISSIDVSKGLIDKCSKYIPPEFKKKKHPRYK